MKAHVVLFKRNRLLAGFCGALVAAGCSTTGASAQVPSANYYVSPSGSDSNSGTVSAPFATINKALSVSNGGQTIAVASGTYSYINDTKARTQNVTVLGYGSSRPVITSSGNTSNYAVLLSGAQYITFNNFKFQGTVRILSSSQTVKNITVKNSEITNAGVAVYIIKSAQNITFDNNWIHGASYGIFNNNQPGQCNGINIINNLIEDMTVDGIQFCRWDNVLINKNVIRNIHRVSGDLHNDCVQLSGSSQNVTISNNMLYDSTTQNVMIKPDFGPIDTLRLENNLIYKTGGVSVQVSNTSNARIVNNTIWNKGFGDDGMYLRGAGTTNAIVANNCFSTFRRLDGAGLAFEDYNLSTQTGLYGPHDIRNSNTSFVTAAFVDVANGNYHPSTNSQLKGKGTPVYAPTHDLDGVLRSTTAPTLGAYETTPSSTTLATFTPVPSVQLPLPAQRVGLNIRPDGFPSVTAPIFRAARSQFQNYLAS